jgi:hypothetical protein
MIRLERHDIKEIWNDYPPIFESVFKEWTDDGNCPSVVYYGYEDGNFVGFVAGYPLSSACWYMQRTGYTVQEQNKLINLRRTREVVSELHKDWRYIFTMVSNTDNTVLKMLLSVDFRIMGTRMDTERNLWVELMNGE